MGAAVVSRADRRRMADDLQALGLYATANGVRRGSVSLSAGVAHVRDYCLPQAEGYVERVREKERLSPPVPGTCGASMLANCEARRDALADFIRAWAPYDFSEARS